MDDELTAQIDTVRARRRRPGDCVPAAIAALTGVDYDALPLPVEVPYTRRDAKIVANISVQTHRCDWSNLGMFVDFYKTVMPRWTARYNELLEEARAPVRLRFHRSHFTDDVALAGCLSVARVGPIASECMGHMLLARDDEVVFDPGDIGPVVQTAPRFGWFEVVPTLQLEARCPRSSTRVSSAWRTLRRR